MMLPRTHRHLVLPPLHPALEPYRAELAALAKPAWLLECRRGECVSRFRTHIGGNRPFLPVGSAWPVCNLCGKPLQFVWQVDFADFNGVGVFADRGLYQFFYCWDCFALPQDGIGGYTSRWYPAFAAQEMRSSAEAGAWDAPAGAAARVAARAVEIAPFFSVPGKSDVANPMPPEAQNQRVGDGKRRLWSVYSFTEGFYLEDEMVSRVGGYPPWVQHEDDTPRCPVCGAWAAFAGAIGSDDTGLMWGDSGYWYFFACRETPACRGLADPMMVLHTY